MALDKITSITGPASELNAQYQTALAQTQTILDGISTSIVGGTLYESYGDSITLATQVGVTNGGFRTLLATQNNWTNTNHAVSGDQALDQSLIAVQKTITDSDDQRFTLMVGYNDQRLYLGSVLLQGFFRRYLGATIVWLTIPNSRKLFGTDLTNMPETGSGWGADAVIGRRTNVAGATKSFTVTGREIYLVSLLHDDPGAGTATITIDGVSYGTMTSLGTGATSLNGHKFAPALYRFGGLDDTAHSVVITVDGTGYFYIEWAAGNSGLPMLHGPQLWVGGITRGSSAAYVASGGSDALVGEYNDEIIKAITELGGDGLAVKYVQTSFIDPIADTLDGIHPNDGGHVKLANSFESRINSLDPSPVLTGSNVALSNLESTAINIDLLVGVSDGAALGSALKQWSDLFLASGAVIDFNNGDVVLAHSNNKLTLSGGTFAVPDDAYDATTWNGNTDVPTKNAVRDKIESLSGLASPLTTKGDIWAYSTADGRFPTSGVSDGWILTKDAASTFGMKWAAAVGTGDALTTNPLSQFAATTSAQLAGVLTDESGTSGGFVRAGGASLSQLAGLAIRSTGAAYDLTFATSEVLTAARTLSIVLNDAARTLTISGNATISGTNTGDQTSVSGSSGSCTGNAATATALATARAINGVNFDGTAAITITAAAGTLTGGTLASGVLASSLTSLGTIASLVATTASISGGSHTGITSLGVRDTSAAFDVTIAGTSSTALTTGRTLTLDLVNAGRTLKLTGNPTIADWFDQSVKTTASPTFAALTLTAALAVAQGGTGSTTASGARSNLGAVNIAGDTFTGNVTLSASIPLLKIADNGGSTPGFFLASGVSSAQIAINRSSATGVFDDTAKASSRIVLNSANADANFEVWTTATNNVNPSRSMLVDKNGGITLDKFGAGTLSTNASGVVTASDEGLKNIHGSFNRGLDAVLRLNPIEFSYKDTPDVASAGLSAQDVERTIPEAIGYIPGGWKNIDDRTVIAVLINAVKELKSEIDQLRSRQ